MKFNQVIIALLLFFPYVCLGSEQKIPQLYNDEIFAIPQSRTPYLASEKEVNIFIEKQKEKQDFKKDAKKLSVVWNNYDSTKRMQLDPKIYRSIQQRFGNTVIDQNEIAILQNQVKEDFKVLRIQAAIIQKEIATEEAVNEQLKKELALLTTQITDCSQKIESIISTQNIELTTKIPAKRKRNRKKKNILTNQHASAEKISANPVSTDNNSQKKPMNYFDNIKKLFKKYHVNTREQLLQKLQSWSEMLEITGKSNCFKEVIEGTNYSFSFCGTCQEFKIFHNTATNIPLYHVSVLDTDICKACVDKSAKALETIIAPTSMGQDDIALSTISTINPHNDNQIITKKPKKRKNRKRNNQTPKIQETAIVLEDQLPNDNITKEVGRPPLKVIRQLLQQYNKKNQAELIKYLSSLCGVFESQNQPNCFKGQIEKTDYCFSYCKECEEMLIFPAKKECQPLKYYKCIEADLCEICVQKSCLNIIINSTEPSSKEGICKINGLTINVRTLYDEIIQSEPKKIVTYAYDGQKISEITLQPGIATD
jgi:hypothetical protein